MMRNSKAPSLCPIAFTYLGATLTLYVPISVVAALGVAGVVAYAIKWLINTAAPDDGGGLDFLGAEPVEHARRIGYARAQ